ncbi:MAG: DedA family protein [Leptospiraceae bacterium]|nr:DedA family protein [Leptospiraceae bacterium]
MLDVLNSCDTQYWFLLLLALSFLAATLLPLSSEASLTAALLCGYSPVLAVISSSAGNCLASLLNYYMGYYGGRPALLRIVRSTGGRWTFRYVRRYGSWALFATVLPVVGDPINVVAGFFRLPIRTFVLIVFISRVVRYIILAALFTCPYADCFTSIF